MDSMNRSLCHHLLLSLIVFTLLVTPLEGLKCYACYYHGGFPEGKNNNTKSCLIPGPQFLEEVQADPLGDTGGIIFYPYCQTEEAILEGHRYVQRTNSWFATDDQDGKCLTDLPTRDEGTICYCNKDGCNGQAIKDIKKKKTKKETENNKPQDSKQEL